jgi:hypothetical protein
MAMTMLARTLGLCVLVASTNACFDDDDDDDGHHDYDAPDPSTSFYTTIDANEALTAVPGEGIGAMIEYGSGGTWAIWTTCDTAFSGYACGFEIDVYTYALLDDVRGGADLEADESIQIWDDYSFTFFASTDYDTDTMEFFTAPGELVEMELVLDGYIEPMHFRWVGNNTVHNEGAPSSPVVFQPDQP